MQRKRSKLIEWHHNTDIIDVNFIKILNDLHIEVPQKKQVEFVFEKESPKIEVKKWAIYQYALNGKFIAEFSNKLKDYGRNFHYKFLISPLERSPAVVQRYSEVEITYFINVRIGRNVMPDSTAHCHCN